MANFIPSAPVAPEDYELYIREFLEDPQIDSLPFNLVNTKFRNRKLYFNSDLTGAAYKKTLCGWNFDGGIGFTSKDLIPVEVARAIEQCYTPLINTIFADGLPDGWKRGTLSPEVLDYMQRELAHSFNLNLLQLLMLGDDALSINPYQIKDGMYKRLKEGSVMQDGTVDANVTLDATSLNQANFYNTMLQIYNAAPSRMRRILVSRKTDLVWIWTDRVYASYVAFMTTQTQTNAGIIQREGIVEGLEFNKFMGIPILVVPWVDDALASDFPAGSPSIGEDPYRVVLTQAKNHFFMLDGSGFKDIHIWYEDKDDKVYATVSALFEYNYAYGDMNVFSGF